MGNRDTVLARTFYNNIEANIIKGRLESEGISCFLTNEIFSTLMPHLNYLTGGGTHLFVMRFDYEKTGSILDAIDNQHRIEGVIVCPECGSDSIKIGLGKSKLKIWIIILLSSLFAMQFSNIKTSYICRNCDHQF